MEIQLPEPDQANNLQRVTSNLNRDKDDYARRTTTFHEPSELPPSVMSLSALADHCMSELNNYRRGEPSDDRYGIELFRRALLQHDPLAWEIVQKLFNEMVLHWMRSHPMRKVACCHDSEENYVAQAFTRFWQATAVNQETEFRTIAGVLRYLRASLNGAILDTLRTYARAERVSLREPNEPGEIVAEDREASVELWEVIQALIPDERQRRVAYLLFHCNLKPREIVHYCSQEFGEVEEIYRLRRNIVDRLLRNIDYIRWRFDTHFH